MARNTPPAARGTLLILISATIVLGGLSRLSPSGMPWWDKYVGDLAYAACGTFLIALFWNRIPVPVAPLLALAGCVAIELFQLTGIPQALNQSDVFVIRAFAYLVLGSAFSWWDIMVYIIGVILAALADAHIARKPAPQ